MQGVWKCVLCVYKLRESKQEEYEGDSEHKKEECTTGMNLYWLKVEQWDSRETKEVEKGMQKERDHESKQERSNRAECWV